MAAAARGLVNLGLLLLAGWCVARLVRDCTQIDDQTDVAARGLLQAAGLEDLDPRAEDRRRAGAPADEPSQPEPRGWLERWQRSRAERRKRRTPGVTVVWFSLAALPLFGLGQSLIPAADLG